MDENYLQSPNKSIQQSTSPEGNVSSFISINDSDDSDDGTFLTRKVIITKPKKRKKRVYDDDDCLDVDVNALAAKEKKADVEKKHKDDKKSGKLDKFKKFQEGKERRREEKMAMRMNLNFSARKKLSKQERA